MKKKLLPDKPTIAVVDDDPSVLRALDRLIRSHGGSAQLFSSAADFLASPWASLANCLILDVQMPGMGGLDLYGWYRQHGHSAPVIFITAHEDAETEARAAEAGAVGFFYKPFHSERLWQAVEKALHVAAAPRD